MRTYFAESDRGCVLLMFEELDDMLLELHKAHVSFHTGEGTKLNNLFKWPGPISSFASRAKIAYAYGLISKETFDDLERLREIRNVAAHPTGGFSFSEIAQQLKAIKAHHRHPEGIPLTKLEQKTIKKPFPFADQGELKLFFCATAMALALEIMAPTKDVLKHGLEQARAKRKIT